MNIERVVHGTVLMLRCHACGATFPHFLFSGENDTATAGLCSLSRCNQNEVYIGEATAVEWNDFEGASRKAFEKRMRHEFGVSDLKVIRLLRVEEIDTSMPGQSFQEFRKSYTPPFFGTPVRAVLEKPAKYKNYPLQISGHLEEKSYQHTLLC